MLRRRAVKGKRLAQTRIGAGHYPEGAGQGHLFYGWVVVAAAMAGSFAVSTTTTESLSVYIKPIADQFGWSRTVLSGGVALGTLLCAPVSLLIGPMLDRYGSRLVVAIAGAVIGAAFMGLVFTQGPVTFYIAVASLRAAGVGVMGLAITTTVANWFIRKRGRAIALEGVGGSVSIIVMPLLAQLVSQTYGWRIALTMVAVVVWAVSIVPALLFLKRRPEDMGLQPDGLNIALAREKAPDVVTAAAGRNPKQVSEAADSSWRLGQAIHTTTLWLLIAAMSLTVMVMAGATLHQTAYLTERGLSPVAAAAAVSFLALGTGVSRLVWGFLSERVPVRFCMAAATMLMALGIVVLLKATSAPLAYLATFLFGVGMSGTLLESVIFANYFGRLHLGTIRGFASFFRWVTAATGPLIGGIGYDLAGGYTQVYLLFLGTIIVASVLLLVSMPPRRRATPATAVNV